MSDAPKLTRVHRLDSIKLDETFFTEEGYLIDHPIVTSVGIFDYKNPDGSRRRELRLPEHVFADESLATYEGKPVIITHDAMRVNKNNVNDEHVGTILSKGYRDGDDVRVKIIIHNIDEVKASGLRELSLGYDLELDETPGEWNGQPYDAVQTEIRINHLALVNEARAGEQARLNIDGETQTLRGERSMGKQIKSKAMNDEERKKAVAAYNARRQRRLDEGEPDEPKTDCDEPNKDSINGEADPSTVVSPEEKVQLIKDRRDRRDQEGDPENPESAMGVIAQQDEDINTLLDIIEGLQAKSDFDAAVPAVAEGNENKDEENEDDEDLGAGKGAATVIIKTDSADTLDAIVRERIKLGRLGDRLNLDGLEEMKPLDAKKAIIKKVNPGMRLDGKSKAYVNAAFDVAVDQINTTKDTNYQRRQASSRMDSTDYTPTGKTAAERSRERMIDKMMNGGNE